MCAECGKEITGSGNDRSKFVGSGLNADVLNGFSRAIVMLCDASEIAKMNHSLDDLT